ncbi:adenylate kinase [Nakamurella sp. GG22]
MPIAPDLGTASRIFVYGVTGSGKSTLAAHLSAVTGIPWQPVDDLTWEPGWVSVPLDEQRRRISAICERDEWILDAAYSTWLDIPLERVQVIVGLDYARWRSLARLTRRTAARVLDGRSICNGNRETLRNVLSRDSLFVFQFRSFARKRATMREWEAAATGPGVLRLRSPRQARRAFPGL